MCTRLAETLGSLLPLRPRRFRRDPRFLPDAVPRSLAQTVHPLVSFTPLQSPPFHICRRCLQRRRLPWGCGPSSRHDRPASVQRASQLPLPFRPRRFARPRRFSPPAGSWVYFTPLPRPGFALQGMSLSHSRSALQRLVPSRQLAPPRCSGCPKRHTSSPCPQGFHPCESPWLLRRGLAVAKTRSPRGLLLLQVLRLDVAPMPSHQLPLVTFMRVRHSRPRTGLQRSLPPSPTPSPEDADLLEVLCLSLIASLRSRRSTSASAHLPAAQPSRQPFSESTLSESCTKLSIARKNLSSSVSGVLILCTTL